MGWGGSEASGCPPAHAHAAVPALRDRVGVGNPCSGTKVGALGVGPQGNVPPDLAGGG